MSYRIMPRGGDPVSTFCLGLCVLLSHLQISWAAPPFGQYSGKVPVNILLMLPSNNSYLFSQSRLMPALQIALDTITSNATLLPHHQITVRYADTECNERVGMNHAISHYINKTVDVFLGPVCDYVVAPIIRQTYYWDLPLISIGANAREFITKRKQLYHLLTRVGPVHHLDMVNFFVKQLELRKWNKIKLIYDRNGQDKLVIDFCHFTTESMVYDIKEIKLQHGPLEIRHFKIDGMNYEKILLEQIDKDFGDSLSTNMDVRFGLCLQKYQISYLYPELFLPAQSMKLETVSSVFT
ncbi:Nitrogen permease regulator 3 [Bulinus truncatus]|nr:Nitrogen permease regulator 3 [Bulinus truncatus]